MDIEIFTLCDAAIAGADGKMSLLGTFDTIYVQRTPAVHPQATVALRLRFTRAENGNHTLRVLLIDEDGRGVGPAIDANITATVPDGLETHTMNLVWNLQALPIPRFRPMHFDLVIDAQHQGRLPIYIRQFTPPAQGDGPGQVIPAAQ